MCTQKMRGLSYIGAEKITFPAKPDRQTYRRTDISFYRLASLLKDILQKSFIEYYLKLYKHLYANKNLKCNS